MDEITQEKIKITTRQILLTFLDIGVDVLGAFEFRKSYRIPIREYQHFRQKDRAQFSQQLYQLKRAGFVKRYFDGKEEFLEITNKGKTKLKKIITDDLEIGQPAKWDRKWRLVIFDIPDERKRERDMVRDKLEQLGFTKLQESVYVHPFECREQIRRLKQTYLLDRYVLYIEADRIETEVDMIKVFYDAHILEDSLLDKKRKTKKISHQKSQTKPSKL